MGEHRFLGGMEMLGDVADAAAASHTRRMLTRHAAEAMARHFSLSRLELGWCEDTGIDTAQTFVFESGGEIHETTGLHLEPEIARAIQNGKSAVGRSRADERTVLIPLLDPEQAPGFARITFSHNTSDRLSEEVLNTLGRILAFAQRHCRLIERIAQLSSTAHHENQELRGELRKYAEADHIVARSESMRRVLENVNLVASHDTTVLLRGESGTGKELLARRIHRLSKRARQPFVSVNCGALPETLIESELFGHEKGAFTGAVTRHVGRFERAHNGTIFLDEVAELPQAAQVKLLRVLQDGELERLGGESIIHVNVRVLAATHRSLETMIEQGAFRADLFYRINVFPIVIPPLRDRKDDIPALAHALLAETAARLRCQPPSLGPKAISQLLDCPWRGNVRELANAIERAVIVTQGRELTFLGLSSEADSVSPPSVSETFDTAARRTIQDALASCGGRIYGGKGAAIRLGMKPSTLQSKMRRLGIDRRTFLDR